jgi:hypothetical protein
MSDSTFVRTPRELAHRVTDGLEVSLFWCEWTNELTVCVSDERSGAYFELDADADKALDVFYHPYSYAASRSHHVRGRVAHALGFASGYAAKGL